MYKSYPSIHEIEKEVTETYASFAQLIEQFGWNVLSYDGANTCEAYAIMDEAVRPAGSVERFVNTVANEVYKLNNEVKALLEKAAPKDADEKSEVRNILIRYIFDNCNEEIYKAHEEFCVPYPHKRAC